MFKIELSKQEVVDLLETVGLRIVHPEDGVMSTTIDRLRVLHERLKRL